MDYTLKDSSLKNKVPMLDKGVSMDEIYDYNFTIDFPIHVEYKDIDYGLLT